MQVRLSDRAEQDLVDIALYIAIDSPEQAVHYTDRLQQACEALADQSLRFPLLPRYEAKGYRRRPYGRYSIIYVVSEAEVTILRVVNAAMNLNSLLSD